MLVRAERASARGSPHFEVGRQAAGPMRMDAPVRRVASRSKSEASLPGGTVWERTPARKRSSAAAGRTAGTRLSPSEQLGRERHRAASVLTRILLSPLVVDRDKEQDREGQQHQLPCKLGNRRSRAPLRIAAMAMRRNGLNIWSWRWRPGYALLRPDGLPGAYRQASVETQRGFLQPRGEGGQEPRACATFACHQCSASGRGGPGAQAPCRSVANGPSSRSEAAAKAAAEEQQQQQQQQEQQRRHQRQQQQRQQRQQHAGVSLRRGRLSCLWLTNDMY
eukprot:365546-Chlamydomonas_euryale.AAC.5